MIKYQLLNFSCFISTVNVMLTEQIRRGCSCSEEEKSSQQEDGVGDEVGGVALLHQAGAVTPGDEQ